MAILLASLTWLAFHYVTGAVRIWDIKMGLLSEQWPVFASNKDTWVHRLYVHFVPIITRKDIELGRIIWLAAKMVFSWWFFWLFWS